VIVRVEQLYPFLLPESYDLLARYPLTAEVCWVQEEPKNMGPWMFIQDQVQPVLDLSKRTLRYIGRGESASPSAGSLKRHQEEQAYIVEEAFAEALLPKKTRRLVPKKKK
jgi:2-oxoglutarate dehydrogenase E1 component